MGRTLQNVLERACRVHDLLADPSLRRTIGQAGSLPTQPRVHTALTQAVSNPDISPHQIASIVEQDICMSAEVLRLVNSAYFGARRLTDLRSAVKFLGISMIKDLILGVEVFRAFEPGPLLTDFSLAAIQRHALLTGRIAARILPDRQRSEAAFVAGVVHGIGKLILATRCPDLFAKALSAARVQRRPLHEVDARSARLHPRGGRGLSAGPVGLSPRDRRGGGLPAHPPEGGPAGRGRPGGVAHLDRSGGTNVTTAPSQHPRKGPDPAYLQALGATAKLAEWRKMAAAILLEHPVEPAPVPSPAAGGRRPAPVPVPEPESESESEKEGIDRRRWTRTPLEVTAEIMVRDKVYASLSRNNQRRRDVPVPARSPRRCTR